MGPTVLPAPSQSGYLPTPIGGEEEAANTPGLPNIGDVIHHRPPRTYRQENIQDGERADYAPLVVV